MMGSHDPPAHGDVDTVLEASRALVGVAARSLAALPEDVTLPQYRALVVISMRGTAPSGVLAHALGVHPSTVTRLVDRLLHKGLVERQTSPTDRREAVLRLSDRGSVLLEHVASARRAEISAILERMSGADRMVLARTLKQFSLAAADASEGSWALGWAPPGRDEPG